MRMFHVTFGISRWIFEANPERAVALFAEKYGLSERQKNSVDVVEYAIEPGFLPRQDSDGPVSECYLLGG